MRKIFAMVFVVAMVMSLVACGGSSASTAPAETKAPETVVETVAETEAPETVVETEVATTEAVEIETEVAASQGETEAGEVHSFEWDPDERLVFKFEDGTKYAMYYDFNEIRIGIMEDDSVEEVFNFIDDGYDYKGQTSAFIEKFYQARSEDDSSFRFEPKTNGVVYDDEELGEIEDEDVIDYYLYPWDDDEELSYTFEDGVTYSMMYDSVEKCIQIGRVDGDTFYIVSTFTKEETQQIGYFIVEYFVQGKEMAEDEF